MSQQRAFSQQPCCRGRAVGNNTASSTTPVHFGCVHGCTAKMRNVETAVCKGLIELSGPVSNKKTSKGENFTVNCSLSSFNLLYLNSPSHCQGGEEQGKLLPQPCCSLYGEKCFAVGSPSLLGGAWRDRGISLSTSAHKTIGLSEWSHFLKI